MDYNIPSDVVLTTLNHSNWVDSVMLGQFCFYKKFLKVGVRFPLCSFIYFILNFFWITLGQLMPNSQRFLLILLIFNRISEPPFPLDLAIFLHLYYLKDASDTCHFFSIIEENQAFLSLGFHLVRNGGRISSSLCLKIGHIVALTNFNTFGQNFIWTCSFINSDQMLTNF